MSKSDYKQADNNWKRQDCIDTGRAYYKQAIEMEDSNDPNQEKIDALWIGSAHYFFHALVLGHNEAPRCLALAFNQGTGIKEDAYMAALMFGVALELKDPKCPTTKNMPDIPKSMKPAITEVAKLIKATQAKIPATGVDAETLFKQSHLLEEQIALLTGKMMVTFLNSKEIAKQSIAKFAAEHKGWVQPSDEYYQHIMDEAAGGGAAAGGADSHLADAFSALHP